MEFTAATLTDYFSTRFGVPVIVDEVVQYPRGSSRETWFVTLHTPAAPADIPDKLVLRRDFAGGSTDPSPLDQEYFIYERLGHTQVPVARALWWEDNPRWTTRPFYVRQQVAGDWNVPHFLDQDPQYDELRIAVSMEHLRKLALVHAVDWRGLGFDRYLAAPRSPAECAQVNVNAIAQRLDEFRVEAIPIFLEACQWLRDHAPVAPAVCLCKGTNGLGEEIFRGREIVAMSDWEEASIGDPASDFAFMQDFVPEIDRDGRKLWGLEQALAYYREISGLTIAPAAVDYYRIVRALKILLFGHRAALATHQYAWAHIRQAWTGTEVTHVGKRILASAMGWMPPIPPEWFAQLNETVEATR